MKTREIFILLGFVVALLLTSSSSVSAQCPPGVPIDCYNGFCCAAGYPVCCPNGLCCEYAFPVCCPDGCCPSGTVCGSGYQCLTPGGTCAGSSEADGEDVNQTMQEAVPGFYPEGVEEE
jgi:hypothetical protein